MNRTPFIILVHIHDHIYRSDWPLGVRLAGMALIHGLIIEQHLRKG